MRAKTNDRIFLLDLLLVGVCCLVLWQLAPACFDLVSDCFFEIGNQMEDINGRTTEFYVAR